MGIERFGEEVNETVDEGSIEKIDDINVAEIHFSNSLNYQTLQDESSDEPFEISDEDSERLFDAFKPSQDDEEIEEEMPFEAKKKLAHQDQEVQDTKETASDKLASEPEQPLSSEEQIPFEDEDLEYLAEDTTPADEDISIIGKKEKPQKEDVSAPSKARREWNKEENMITGYNEKGQPDGRWYLFEEDKLIQMYTLKDGKLEGLQIIFDKNERPEFVAYADSVDIKDMENLDFHNASMKDRLMDYARLAHLEKQQLLPNPMPKARQNENLSVSTGLNTNVFLSVSGKGGR